MPRRRLWTTISLCALIALSARPAFAQEEEAEALIRRGVELRRGGHDEEALVEFRRAYDLTHSPRPLAQLALAEQALGQWLQADAHLRDALALHDDPWIIANRGALEASLATLNEHIGQVDVRSNVRGGQVLVNNSVVGTLPLGEPVRAVVGTVTMQVQAAGYLPVTRTVVVTAGAMSRENFDLVPVPTVAGARAEGAGTGATTAGNERAASATSVTPARTSSPLIAGGGAVAVVSLLSAGILGASGNGIRAQYDIDCVFGGPASDCNARMLSTQGQLDGLATGINALLGMSIIGVVALGVGLLIDNVGSAPAHTNETRVTRRTHTSFIVGLDRAALRVTW